MLSGKNDPYTNETEEPLENFLTEFGFGAGESKSSSPPPVDPLESHLGIKPLYCREPTVAFTDFYNEPLSEHIEMDKDFSIYKGAVRNKFSFMNYSFILTPATKVSQSLLNTNVIKY